MCSSSSQSSCSACSGSGRGSSSLDRPAADTLETNVQTLGIPEWAACTNGVTQGRLGAAGLKERWRIAEALSAVPDAPWSGRVNRLLTCCAVPSAGITEAGGVGVVWFRCRDRLCPLCCRERARQTEQRVRRAIDNADSLRFITLTVRSDDTPLREQLDALYAWFRELRRTPEWREHVTGAVATVEVTWSSKRQQWHPHLHVLADGSFWAQSSLSAVWARITGGSVVVDIRACRSRREASRYIAKYAGKPPSLERWPPEQIADYAAAIHRRRMVLTTGSMHGRAPDQDSNTCPTIPRSHRVPLHEIERRAARGCSDAQCVLAGLVASCPGYARSVEVRGSAAPPYAILCRRVLRESRACMRRLAAAWQNATNGGWWGQADAHDAARPPPPPPKPPPRPRMRDHTAALADWHSPDPVRR